MTTSPHRLSRDLGTVPRLTADEEKDLARRIRAGDREARDRLISCNIPLALRIARKYSRGRPRHEDDIIGLAMPGLIVAADKFDPDLGTRFSTYASYWIRQTIGRGIAGECYLIRVPYNLMTELGSKAGGPDPKFADRARAALKAGVLGMRGYGVRDALDAVCCPQSLGDPPGDISGEVSPEAINRMIDQLSPYEAEVVRARYFSGLDEMPSQAVVARAIGVTRQMINTHERKALAKLREMIGEILEPAVA